MTKRPPQPNHQVPTKPGQLQRNCHDYSAVYEACEQRGTLAVVSARRNSGTGDGPIPRAGERFKRLYRARSAVEREFGRLKHHLSMAPLRVRGLDRVSCDGFICNSVTSGVQHHAWAPYYVSAGGSVRRRYLYLAWWVIR